MSSLSAKRSVTLDHDSTVSNSKRARLYDNGREKYTVGWISALPLEMKAARAMLDEIHDHCEYHPTDNNTYIFGSIAGHNCVLACLPAGIYGTTSATIVGNEMRHSFPNMQFCLLVGVAGGAPTENADIRLGDVIVSIPTARYNGVVQYDYGKTTANGEFEYTGNLNKPPSVLLNTISRIRAELKKDIDVCISKLVSDMLQRHPEIGEEYSHRGQERDILFEPEYEHLQGQATCENCDQQRVRRRPLRASSDPTIHYGTIASGNQVIKHARTRDKFSSELGNLCFEMEAAGLMDVFPSLVIRGICDYSDSHKNKDWQGYAAATASAFAKQLLSVLPPKFIPVSELNGMQEQSMERGVGPSQSQPALVEQRRALWESLAFDQVETRHMTIKNAHLATCKWLLNHFQYQDWLDPEKMSEHHGFLWIKGKPAAGKSTIMKFIFTKTKNSATGTITISYFFNARGEELEKSVLGMYRSLLYQLLRELPHLRLVLDSIPSVSLAPNWSIELLKSLFQNTVEQLSQRSLMCFIDALDECDEDDIRDMLSFFEQLGHRAASAGHQFRVCFSSRHYPNISMTRSINLILEDQDGHGSDIKNYIQTELKAGRGKAVDEIKNELLQRASGIFLWVVLAVQMLNKEYDRGRIHALRKRLREIPDGLHELLEDILTRNGQNTDETVLCLQWVLFARHPLKIDEAYFAIMAGLNPDEKFLAEWDPEIVTPEVMHRFILDSSKGLAETTRSKVPKVQFIHESVRDFLLKEGGLDRIQSHSGNFTGVSHDCLKRCCMAYIALDPALHMSIKSPLPKASSEDAKALRQRVGERFPFLHYAVQNLLHHANSAEQFGVGQASFIQNFPFPKWILLNNLFEKYEIRQYKRGASFLYVFAEKNLDALIPLLSEQAAAHHTTGQRYGSPLIAAYVNGNEEAMRKLIALPGFDVNVKARDGMSVLQMAARKGTEMIVQMLVESGADIESRNHRSGMTPLAYASQNGHKAIVQMLLDKRANIESGDRAPLSWASGNGHEAIVSLLLERGADIEIQDTYGCTPLLWASRNGHEAIARLLLKRGADIEIRDTYGCTPLLWASINGREAIVRLLLERGADIEIRDRPGRTPLLGACEEEYKAVARILLERGANIEAQDGLGRTPLFWASRNGNEALVGLLLEGGADIRTMSTSQPM